MSDRHWFEDVADHLGPAYLRYSFTMGTDQEVEFLLGALGLEAGMEVLDVGCGPGRHAVALAKRGIRVFGVDISERFLEVANDLADEQGVGHLVEFHRADARALELPERFDAAISLCQGAFGLGGPPDGDDPQNLVPDASVLGGVRAALVPGGRVAVSAFSSYFQVRYLEDHDTFDAEAGVNHERTVVKDPQGAEAEVDLWTTCFTPRELRLLAAQAGLEVRHLWSVTPGRYAQDPPSTGSPELLLVAVRP